MSVVYSCQHGAFLDHYFSTSQNYTPFKSSIFSPSANSLAGPVNYRWKKELFLVDSPFMMDSQVERLKRESEVAECGGVTKETSAQKKRKKKLKNRHHLSEQDEWISEIVSSILPTLINEARKANHLKKSHPALRHTDNNNKARMAAEIVGCGDLFESLCCSQWEKGHYDQSATVEPLILVEGTKESMSSTSVVGRQVQNLEETSKMMSLDGQSFIVPGLSSFLTSDFQHFITHLFTEIKVDQRYDLIVVDPPWFNKSVKRKKSYQMVQESDLKQIPISELAGKDCIVCIWITNNERLQHFVKEELFPHWSVDWVADWIWIKVTGYGELVCDIQSHHKKPYEQLILGCFNKPCKDEPCYMTEKSRARMSSIEHTKAKEQQISGMKECKPLIHNEAEEPQRSSIPQNYILASIPCSLHSKKPPLEEIMLPYLPSKPCCLELFARNLLPGWTSWGNEPLRHQHVAYFEEAL